MCIKNVEQTSCLFYSFVFIYWMCAKHGLYLRTKHSQFSVLKNLHNDVIIVVVSCRRLVNKDTIFASFRWLINIKLNHWVTTKSQKQKDHTTYIKKRQPKMIIKIAFKNIKKTIKRGIWYSRKVCAILSISRLKPFQKKILGQYNYSLKWSVALFSFHTFGAGSHKKGII